MSNDQWKTRLGFILAAIGSAIGLGNIWRFSWLAYRNGGGSFLIPYFIALAIVGIPIMILEFLLGHYFRAGAPKAYAKVAKMEWFGWFAILNSFLITTYYAVVLSWVLIYVLLSFKVASLQQPRDLFDVILSTHSWIIASLIITWVLAWYVVYRGIAEGIEKVSKRVIPILWILATVLVIRGLTLPNATQGIGWYLSPNFGYLTNAKTWIDAFGQIFFSLSLGSGIMIAYAKYLPRNTELVNSARIVSLANCGFSFFFGFATWSIIGYLMMINNVTSPANLNMPLSGASLAFITIPTALLELPGKPLTTMIFSFIFFLLLYLAGFTSLISLIEAFYVGFADKFKIDRQKGITAITIAGILLGIPYVLNANLIEQIDFIAGSTLLVFVGLIEAMFVAYFTNARRFVTHANRYAKTKIGRTWIYMLRVAVISLALVLICGILEAGEMLTSISITILFILLILSIVLALKK